MFRGGCYLSSSRQLWEFSSFRRTPNAVGLLRTKKIDSFDGLRANDAFELNVSGGEILEPLLLTVCAQQLLLHPFREITRPKWQGTALEVLQLSGLVGNQLAVFSYDMLALSVRSGREMKPRHAPRRCQLLSGDLWK